MIIRTFYSIANINRHIRTSSTNWQLQRILFINMNSQENLYHVTFVIDSPSHHPSSIPVFFLFKFHLMFGFLLCTCWNCAKTWKENYKMNMSWWFFEYFDAPSYTINRSIDRCFQLNALPQAYFSHFVFFFLIRSNALNLFILFFSINFCLTR